MPQHSLYNQIKNNAMLFITATQNYSVFRRALLILKYYDNLLVLLCVRVLMLYAN